MPRVVRHTIVPQNWYVSPNNMKIAIFLPKNKQFKNEIVRVWQSNRSDGEKKKRRGLQLNHVNTPFYKYLMLPALEIETASPEKNVSTEIKYISRRRKFLAIKIKK